MTFQSLWQELLPIGRNPRTGGYRRFAYNSADVACREWFRGTAEDRGLTSYADRNGNLWAWLGDPDGDGPGVVVGSHLDSVPDGGAFDGPLGVVSAFAALDALRDNGFRPTRPIGVVAFADEEGARFGVACAGSRLMTGQLDPDRAAAFRDADGVTMAEAMEAAGYDTAALGRDDEGLRRIGVFVELHIEQGRGLVDLDAPIGIGTGIWPHGRWRLDFPGEANHAGTTRLADRRDAMLPFAATVLAARRAAEQHDAVATFGRVRVDPNGTNAIPSHVAAWLDARAATDDGVRAVVHDLETPDAKITEESWTPGTTFDPMLRDRLKEVLGGAPELPTAAGHDAGILANAGLPAAMVFVRNPTGVSHSPAEHADDADCAAGVSALTRVLERLG